MLSTKLSPNGLRANLSKITKTFQEKQQLSKTLMGPMAARDAEVKRLAAIQNSAIKKLRMSGKADLVNDPAANLPHLVEAKTGIRIIGMDGNPIKDMSYITPTPVPFPMQAMGAMLADPKFENIIAHMYLDSKGLVTVGIGHKISNEGEALQLHGGLLPFIVKSTGLPATPTQVRAEFNFLTQNRTRFANFVASAFDAHLNLKVLPSNAESLAAHDIGVFLSQLRSGTPFPTAEFNSWPEGVQRALLDIVFTVGKQGFLNQFKILPIACWHRDWATAKAQSSRKSVSAARNNAVADLFDPAIQTEKFFISLDPLFAKQRLIFMTDGSLKPIKVGP